MGFCSSLNVLKEKWNLPEEMIFRLPSEAEWEYAARAGSNSTFFFGDSAKPLTNYAWISDNSEGSTKPVGLLNPNQWGFLDIYGNVRNGAWMDMVLDQVESLLTRYSGGKTWTK